MDRHKQAVSKIAATVRSYFARKEPYRIFHGSTNSTRPRPQPGQQGLVDISALNNVLSVDTASRTALVEPNVPMDRLVESTLRHGLVPPIVMEFPGITAGGGFAGTAGESSSFRHGFFDDTVNYVEMVLGNGDVVRADRSQRPDLFRGAAGAVGTLGITTLLELRLMEAKKYVRTTYHRTNSVAEAVARVKAETEDPANDYVDGILFSKDHGVVVTGRLTDDKPADIAPQTFSRARDPWFYLHVRDRTKDLSSAPSSSSSAAAAAASASPSASTSSSATDYVPLAEYLFRYDRAGFWVAAQGWTYFKLVPFTRFFRWFLDDFIHTRMMYRALHASGESSRFVVQDLALPYDSAEEFVDYTAEEFGIWPLWLCPLKQTPPPTFHPYTDHGETKPEAAAEASSSSSSTAAPEAGAEAEAEAEAKSDSLNGKLSSAAQTAEPMLNIGLWGWGPADHATFVVKNRALEDKLVQLGGRKWLYAHTYYSEDEFWRVYNQRAWYDALREKYAATTLPTVYQKVKIDVEAKRRESEARKQSWKSTWPLAGLYGIWKSIQSKDYLLHRHAKWKYTSGDKDS